MASGLKREVTINMLLGGACGKARGWGGARCPPGWMLLCSNEEAVVATLTATAAATAVVYSGSTRVQWSEINDCGGAPSSSGRGRRHSDLVVSLPPTSSSRGGVPLDPDGNDEDDDEEDDNRSPPAAAAAARSIVGFPRKGGGSQGATMMGGGGGGEGGGRGRD